MMRKPCTLTITLFTIFIFFGFQMPFLGADHTTPPKNEYKNSKLSRLDYRIKYEKKLLKTPFAILPHNPSYLLPVTYNLDPNDDMARTMDIDIQPVEIKYQLSLKVALLRKIFKDNGYLYFGYTQQSYWQAYNSLHSAPFRETNYEPELMLSFFNDYTLGYLRNRLITIGIVHQSNGKGVALSRSWNRVYADFQFEVGDLCLGVKPWIRVHENGESDDNPDIEKYIGYGELNLSYPLGTHTLGAHFWNNLNAPNRLGVQLDWTFPLTDKVDGYVQYYGGYGENLIDHDHKNHRLGIGIMIASWF